MKWYVTVIAMVLAVPAGAVDHAWIIGGGPKPDASQAQIELNVNWVIEVLRARRPAPKLHIYYGKGNYPGQDIITNVSVSEGKEVFSPLARVFGVQGENTDRYREHRVPLVAGSTEAEFLKQRLAQEFSALRAGDRALIVYNGHGLRHERDVGQNTLRLWRDTRLSVRELEALLVRIDPAVPVRFVFTQCYSGGFLRLIRPGADDVATLAPGKRCGFAAESEDRESEGCAASIDVGDYRDYTTFFFAALGGRTRLGKPITGTADQDGDGVVSLSEAHLYVLREAFNGDLPRATSEVYLERWQPWYLRWFDTGAEPANLYGRAAQETAKNLGMSETGRQLMQELRNRRARLAAEEATLRREQEGLAEEIKAIRAAIVKELTLRWPAAAHPHTFNYAQFLREDANAAQDFIVVQPRYGELVTKQNRHDQIDQELVNVDRNAARLDMVRRLRRLARLLDQFQRHASASERADFERLTACEREPL